MSKLAKRVGITPDTLRYYERIGLLAPPVRSPSGYRLYGQEAVEQVRFIRGAQRLGLRLQEIGELLGVRQRGLCPCGRTRQLLEARVEQLDEEVEALLHLRREIRRMIEELPVDSSGGCGTVMVLGATRTRGSDGGHHER